MSSLLRPDASGVASTRVTSPRSQPTVSKGPLSASLRASSSRVAELANEEEKEKEKYYAIYLCSSDGRPNIMEVFDTLEELHEAGIEIEDDSTTRRSPNPESVYDLLLIKGVALNVK